MSNRFDDASSLPDADEVLHRGFAQSTVGLAITELDADDRRAERVVRVNDALVDLLGYDADELKANGHALLGLDQFDLDPGSKRIVRRGRDFEETELPLVRKDGREIWAAVHIDTIRDAQGDIRNRAIRIEDIGEVLANDRSLRYLADHDTLTGLINRRRFGEEVQRAIETADRFGDTGAVLFLDLDHFKHVNDAYGHSAGDAYLTEFAVLMREATRSTDVLSRLSGDEFAILLARTSIDDAKALADKIRSLTAELPVRVAANPDFRLTVSIGIAEITSGASENAADLLVDADLAMYEAKQAGRVQERARQEQ